MTAKKHKRSGSVILSLFIVIILILAASAGICTALAFTDNNSSKYTLSETDDTFLKTALKAAVFGSEFSATETQINTYLNSKLCTDEDQEGTLKQLRVFFHENNTADIYTRVKLKDRFFTISAKAEIDFISEDSEAAVKLKDIKIGELPVPSFIADRIIEKLLEDNKYARFENGLVYVKTSYTYDFDDFDFTITLREFRTDDGKIVARTNNLSLEVLKAIRNIIKNL